MNSLSVRFKYLLLPMLFLVSTSLYARPIFVMGSPEDRRMSEDAGLAGRHAASISEIPENSDVILLGNIFIAPDHAPLYDMEKLGCKVIRLSGDDPVSLSASIKAYNDYVQSGKNVFDDIPHGLGTVNQPVLFPMLESSELNKPDRKNTNLGYVPKPIFNTPPAGESDYIPPMLARLASSGRVALDISFESYSSNLKNETQEPLQNLSLMLKANPSLRIVIEGHTAEDSAVNAAYHQKLSEDRALRVKQWLVDSGLEPARIRTAGYGASRPAADNSTKAGQAKNRRIEIVKD